MPKRTKVYPTDLQMAVDFVLSHPQLDEKAIRVGLRFTLGVAVAEEIQRRWSKIHPDQPTWKGRQDRNLTDKVWNEFDPDRIVRGKWEEGHSAKPLI